MHVDPCLDLVDMLCLHLTYLDLHLFFPFYSGYYHLFSLLGLLLAVLLLILACWTQELEVARWSRSAKNDAINNSPPFPKKGTKKWQQIKRNGRILLVTSPLIRVHRSVKVVPLNSKKSRNKTQHSPPSLFFIFQFNMKYFWHDR